MVWKEFDKTIMNIKDFFKHIYYWLLDKNEWIMVVLIILGISSVVYIIKNKSKHEIKKFIGSNLRNIVLIITLSYITREYGSESVINSISKYYNLRIIVAGTLAIVYISESITFYKGEKYKINKKYYKYLYYIFSTFLYAAISIRCTNLLSMLLIIIILVLLDIEFNSKDENDLKVDSTFNMDISDSACIKKEQLFKSRQQELNHILRYINEYKYNESFAISIAGEWGEGKTSVMNVLEQEISNDNRFIISIQPMIVDTRESLAKYFFNKLEDLFNSYGIYTGKGSPLKEYFESIMTIIGVSKNVLVNKILDNDTKTTEDYREKKKALQRDINQLLKIANDNMKKNQIIILIDDFDRVDEKVIYAVLTFIKEIVDFRGCIVIFLMDYQKLKGKDITYEYLDKFINKRFDLKKVERNEILDYYSDVFLNNDLKSAALSSHLSILKDNINVYFENIFSAAQEIIDNFEKQEEEIKKEFSKKVGTNPSGNGKELNDKIEKLSKVKNIFKSYINKCRNITNNTRKVKKMLRDLQDVFKHIDLFYKNLSEDKLKDLYQLINCNKIIFNIIFIKNFIEKEYDAILDSNNIEHYLNIIKNISFDKKSSEQFLVGKILSYNIKEYAITETDSMRNSKANGFINNVFINNYNYDSLSDLETMDEKNLRRIDEKKIVISQDYYDAIVELYDSILRRQWDDGNERTIKRLSIVSEYIFDQVNKGNIRLWELINLILPNKIREDLIFINKEFLYKLKQYLLNTNIIYLDEKQKRSNEYTLKSSKGAIIFKRCSLIAFIVSLVKVYDSEKYSYNSIYSDMKQYDTLEGINNSAKLILNLDLDMSNNSDIDNFKTWIMDCISTIKTELSEYNYIDVRYLEEEVTSLIETFSTVNFIEHQVNITSIPQEYNTKEVYGNESYETLKNEISKLKNFVSSNSDKIDHNVYRYFNQLLIRMEQLSETSVFEDKVIDELDELYNTLSQNYNERLFEYMNWQYSGSKMVKIKINQKNK